MLLCSACLAIPYRTILRLINGDRSVHDTFEWWPIPGARPDETTKRPFIKWRESSNHLLYSHEKCAFCYVLFEFLENSHHYNTNTKAGEKSQVWLQLPNPGGTPELTIVIGDKQPETRISGNVRFSTTPDSPVASFFTHHVVIEDSFHPFVLQKITSWIESCNETHHVCAHTPLKTNLRITRNLVSTATRRTCKTTLGYSEDPPLLTRILDVSSLPTKKDLVRHEGDPRNLLLGSSLRLIGKVPRNRRYVALSYCWGESLTYTTTTANRKTHMKRRGITYAQLPRTLRDAIFIVRYLGLDYLWVDCLCIVQGDKADWEREAAKMASIYSGAYLTISATRAAHSDEGFLAPRVTRARKQVRFTDDEGSFELYFIYDDLVTAPGSIGSVQHQPLRLQKEEPLLNRAWCFQERVLATRTLHFGSDQMYWECAQKFEEEQGVVTYNDVDSYKEYSIKRIGEGLKKAHDSTDPDRSRDAWYQLVQEYTSRDMTKASDKLPALSGILSALQQVLPDDTCYAGIWESWFLRGLLWRLQVPEFDLYVFKPKKARKVDWRAPSWSFASVEGVVLYNNLDYSGKWNECARLEECSVQPKGRNPLGELESGFARIRGPVTKVTEVAHTISRKGRPCFIRLKDQSLTAASIFFDVDAYEDCEVLMITPHAGLAIVPSPTANNSYLRVGVVSIQALWNAVEIMRLTERPERWLPASAYPEPRTITLF